MMKTTQVVVCCLVILGVVFAVSLLSARINWGKADLQWVNPPLGAMDYLRVARLEEVPVTLVTTQNGELHVFEEEREIRLISDIWWKVPVKSPWWHAIGERDGHTVLGRWTSQGLQTHDLSIHFATESTAVHEMTLLIGTADGQIYSIGNDGAITLEHTLDGPVVSMLSWQNVLWVSTGDSILREANGEWTEVYRARSNVWLFDLSGSNDRIFVAVLLIEGDPWASLGDESSWPRSVLMSEDGYTWNDVILPQARSGGQLEVRGLDALGESIVAVQWPDYVALSHDSGETWQHMELPLGMPRRDWGAPIFLFWRHPRPRDVSIHPDGFSRVGYGGELWEYRFSSDEWVLRNAGIRDQFHDVYRSGETMVLVGADQTVLGNESRIYYRGAGGELVDTGVYTDGPLHRVIHNGTRYIAVGGGLGMLIRGHRSRIFESEDGVNWAPAEIEGDMRNRLERLRDVAHGPAGTIAVGEGGEILHSTEPGVWLRLSPSIGSYDFHWACYAMGRYFIAGPSGVWSSDDLSAWTLIYWSVVGDPIRSVISVFDHVEVVTWKGMLLAIDSELRVFLKQQLPFSVQKLFSKDGSYLVISNWLSNYIMTSSDGMRWEMYTTEAIAPLRGASLEEDWLVVGELGQIVRVPRPFSAHPFAERTPRPDGEADTWMGRISDAFYPWIYHNGLGWIWFYSNLESQGGWIWLHDGGRWGWTNAEYYPWVYLYGEAAGWYYQGAGGLLPNSL